LQRHQRDAFQARALPADFGDEIIVGARIGDRVLAFDHAVDGEAAGRKQHRNVDAFFVHVAQARLDVVFFQTPENTAHVGIHAVRRQQAPGALRKPFGQTFSDIGILLDNVAVGIDGAHGHPPSITALFLTGA
jgi:hypothetical protein